jgi:hypothetical protein
MQKGDSGGASETRDVKAKKVCREQRNQLKAKYYKQVTASCELFRRARIEIQRYGKSDLSRSGSCSVTAAAYE